MTSWMPFDLLDHLWQSTLFTAAVWLVARAVRTNAARVRYWLWFAASMKFLIPVSALMQAGEQFAWRTAAVAPPPTVSFVIERVLTPAAAATTTATSAAPMTSSTSVWPVLLLVAWACGVGVVLVHWWRQWQPIRHAMRSARPIEASEDDSLTILASASIMEPGVLGIWRPVLLVPEGIRDRLTPVQLRAVIAHERCHIRQHDNLTAALHMAVEALFWFHPVVWWLERRLIEERERACDEYVLQSGSTPRDYAEGILEVCRFAKEPAPVCVAGVSGSDLRRRIESILENQIGRPLTLERAVALVVCAAAAVLGPVTAGAVQSTTAGAADNRPRFDVASVRENRSGGDQGFLLPQGRQLNAQNYRLRSLIQFAYRVQPFELVGGPDWIDSARFDITAKAPFEPKPAPVGAPPGEMEQMVQTLLAERFTLQVHRETREIPVYALVLARRDGQMGQRLRREADVCAASRNATARGEKTPEIPTRADGRPACGMMGAGGRFFAGGVTLAMLASALSPQAARVVVDRTGLSGYFEADIEFSPDALTNATSERPSFFTALEEQLGLRLEPARAPVELLVIDRVERPTEN